MSSNFNFYVNRQGVQGKRGAKGEQGFSPVISVESQTANEYILRVENEDGSFLSPNLRGNAIENSGGTYIRFNPETEQMYTGYADSATTEQAGVVRMGVYDDLVAGESEELVPNVADVHDFVQNSIGDISGFVTTEQFNTYTSNTAITLDNLSNNKLDASTFNSYASTTDGTLESLSTNKLDASTFDSFANSTSSALNTLDTDKLDFTDLANSLVQGSNVTLTTDTVNKTITISSSGGGGGGSQVQANWAETDNTDPSFIQNKPTLGTMAAADTSDYTPTVGLSDVAISGSYNDLLNKPVLGTMASESVSDYTPTANLAEVATTGDYDDLINKPTIPAAANDGTITITQGGVIKGSFTTNQSANDTIDIDAGGGSSLTAGNGIDISSLDVINIVQEDSGYTWNDITIVGTPTLYDGIYSGFSASDYIYMNNYPSSVSSFEMQFDFITGTLNNTVQYFTYPKTEEGWEDAPYIFVNTENKAVCRFYNNNSDIMFYSTSALQSNTEYIVKLVFNGITASCTIETGGVVASMQDSNGNTSVSASTVNFNDAIKIGMPSWTGGVRLNNSYIKVNGSYYGITTVNPPAKATSSLYGLVKPDGSTTQVTNGVISTVNTVQSTTVNNIVQITQADYDALATKDANTLYVIIPASS